MRCRGTGPTPCEFMLVAECPGYEEAKVGVPLVGKTGQEVNRYLNGYDLPHREDVFLTNLYREFVHKDYEYTAADLERDEPELLEELALVQPRIIVTLGRHAARWFLGEVDMEDVHGIPWTVSRNDWTRRPIAAGVRGGILWNDSNNPGDDQAVVFPIYHPAAGFHNPEIQGYVSYGFAQLAAFLNGDLTPRRLFEDPYEGKEDYGEATEADLADLATDDCTRLAIDTEGSAHAIWSVQYSARPGHGRTARAGTPSLRRLGDCYLRAGPLLGFHHALHDLVVLRPALGSIGHVVAPDWADGRIDDTMTKAWLLQVEPQGLKSLGIRHANMRMESYDDVLGDANTRVAVDWLTANLDLVEMEHRCVVEAAYDRAVDAGRRLRTWPKLPKSRLHKALERCLKSKRPRGLWEDQDDDIKVAAYALGKEMPEATLSHVPYARALRYACRDADATWRVNEQLDARIDAMGLRDLYDLEVATYPLLARMMQAGVKPDLRHFQTVSYLLGDELTRLQGQLVTATGIAGFNANSGDQTAAYLFGTLALPPGKRTESGRGTTNDKYLEALEHEHGLSYPEITLIRTYRGVYKLKYTFVDRIPDYVHRYPFDGRVHCTIKPTRTPTGRLAAANPNMLAQPEHGEFALYFKMGWVAEPGHVVANWDASQIELRGLAHLSQDPVMLGVFRGEIRNPDGSPIDLHAALAQRIFGVAPKDQDVHKHRYPVKEINFGLPNGMRAQGLALALRSKGIQVDEDDAQRWLDETMNLYKGVPAYQERMKREAQRTGMIRCPRSKRIRYIGGINSRNSAIRGEAERLAFSTPIQELAQDIMKHAEAVVWKDIIVRRLKQGQWIEPLLQVHDALKLEMAQGLQFEVHKEMVAAMTQSYPYLSVPLAVEGAWGENFGEMETF